MSPRYAHDCPACRFLGRVAIYDLYVCREVDAVGNSLIARRSSEPSDYSSMCDFRHEVQQTIRRETGGLDVDASIVLAMFRMMPSLILNLIQKD